MSQNNSTQYKRGFSVYFAIIIMAFLLSIGVGINTILLSQLKTLRGVGDSVFAFGAADAGIERALYIDKIDCDIPPVLLAVPICINANLPGTVTLSNGSRYSISIEEPGVNGCPGATYCAKAEGAFQGSSFDEPAHRRIRISR